MPTVPRVEKRKDAGEGGGFIKGVFYWIPGLTDEDHGCLALARIF